MQNSYRLSSEERRQAIVEAVKGVFAEKGFDGTTTRELASAAGVSEALSELSKHALVASRRGKVSILDRKGLEKVACECYRTIKDREAKLLT